MGVESLSGDGFVLLVLFGGFGGVWSFNGIIMLLVLFIKFEWFVIILLCLDICVFELLNY